MKFKIFCTLLVAIPLTGCVTGNRSYAPPVAKSALVAPNFKEVGTQKDEVWAALVSGLGSQFFVVNNMDKASGFINVSYSGDPEKYVDGGELVFKVSNLRGPREYRFPASRANTQYENVDRGILITVQRRLSLEGRMNVVVTDVVPGRTRVTVSTRYVLTLNAGGHTVTGQPLTPVNETIAFITGGEAKLTSGTTFRSTGELESAVLSLVK